MRSHATGDNHRRDRECALHLSGAAAPYIMSDQLDGVQAVCAQGRTAGTAVREPRAQSCYRRDVLCVHDWKCWPQHLVLHVR